MGIYELGDSVHFIKENGNAASLTKEKYRIIHVSDGEETFLIVSESDIYKAELSNVLNDEVDFDIKNPIIKVSASNIMYDHEVNKFAKTVASFMLYDHDADFKKGNPEFIDLIHLSNDSEAGDISEDEIKELVNELNEFMFTEIDGEELYTNFTASSIDELVSLINDTYSFDCIHEFDV